VYPPGAADHCVFEVTNALSIAKVAIVLTKESICRTTKQAGEKEPLPRLAIQIPSREPICSRVLVLSLRGREDTLPLCSRRAVGHHEMKWSLLHRTTNKNNVEVLVFVPASLTFSPLARHDSDVPSADKHLQDNTYNDKKSAALPAHQCFCDQWMNF